MQEGWEPHRELFVVHASCRSCHKTRYVCLSAMTDRILVHCQLRIIPLSRQHFAPNEQQYRQCSYCLSHILCCTTTRQQKLDGHS